jgi:hypothetical protein
MINESRARNALDYLYGSINDKRVQRMAVKFKNSRPRLTSEGFGPKTHGSIEVPRRWKRE